MNGLIYATRGKWSDAGMSLLGMIPLIGDVGKLGKFGSKLSKLSKAGDVVQEGRFIADKAGNVLDTKLFKGLEEVSATVKGNRGGTQLPLHGNPGTYANLGNGHKIVYGAEGRALFDVSKSRIKSIEWNQAPNGNWFPAKGSRTKFQGPVPQSVLDALGF